MVLADDIVERRLDGGGDVGEAASERNSMHVRNGIVQCESALLFAMTNVRNALAIKHHDDPTRGHAVLPGNLAVMSRCPRCVLHLDPGARGGQVASNRQYNVGHAERKIHNRIERQAIGSLFQRAEIHTGVSSRDEARGQGQAPVVHRDEIAIGAVELLRPGDRG